MHATECLEKRFIAELAASNLFHVLNTLTAKFELRSQALLTSTRFWPRKEYSDVEYSKMFTWAVTS